MRLDPSQTLRFHDEIRIHNIHSFHRTLLGLLVACLSLLGAADAGPVGPLLSPLFSDTGVLQRDHPVAVWGWATPGAEVTLTITGTTTNGKRVTVQASRSGRWQATVGPYPAGGPYVLTAISGTTTAEAKDVMIGDVWLCSGQSNMTLNVSRALPFRRPGAGEVTRSLVHLKRHTDTALHEDPLGVAPQLSIAKR